MSEPAAAPQPRDGEAAHAPDIVGAGSRPRRFSGGGMLSKCHSLAGVALAGFAIVLLSWQPPPPPNSAEVLEGEALEFTVVLTRPVGHTGPVSVDYTATAATATAAPAGLGCGDGNYDYKLAGDGTLRWAEDDSADKSVWLLACSDSVHPELDETVTITLSNQIPVGVGINPDNASGIIKSTQATVQGLDLACAASGTGYDLTFSFLAPGHYYHRWKINDGAWSSYIWQAGNQTYSVTRSVTTPGVYTAAAQRATGQNTNWVDPPAIISVECVVPPPQATISDVTVAENAGTADFTVSLNKAWTSDVSVVADTRDGTAIAGSDYTAVSGEVVTILTGDTSATVSVPITDDTSDEPAETFDIVLSSPSIATLGSPSSATATITDNDDPPVVSVSDVSFIEDYSIVLDPPFDINGDGTPDDEYLYSLDVDFTVELDRPSTRQVSVTASTADGTATGTAGWCPAYAPDNTGSIDYRSGSQTFIFTPGETSKTFTVRMCPDTIGEGNETFSVELSSVVNATLGDAGEGEIRDNDATSVTLDGGVTAVEGNALDFTVRLSTTVGDDVTVTVSTADDPAATYPADATGAQRDYDPRAGYTVTIPDGFQTATVSVTTVADTIDEFDETFILRIDSATSIAAVVVGATDTAVGTIDDDDAAPEVSIGDASASESGPITFNLTLTTASSKPVSVVAATADTSPVSAAGVTVCSAIDGSEDYQDATSTATFAPYSTTATFTVTVCDDTVAETDETFAVTLSGATNATVSPTAGSAVGTVLDDDAPPPLCGVGWIYEPGHPDADPVTGCRPGFVS